MATAQSKLDILINAKNNASPAINQLKGDLKSIDDSAGNLSKGLGGLAAGAGVAGLVALAGAAANAGMELARLSAMSQDVEASMTSLAARGGESAATMLEGLDEASRGAISDYDLMLTANRAMLLGVAQNTEQMVALMDVARARSQALGVTTADAFGDIVTGIGRMSPLILDNLGIVVDQAQANAIYAESIGKVASQLSEQEKKQALVNAVIKDSAQIVAANVAAGDDAASNFERMDAALQNARTAMGELFQPAMVVVANAIADAAQDAADMMEGMTEEAVKQGMEVVMLDQRVIGLENDIGQLEQGLRRLRDAGQENSAVYQENAAILAALKAEVAQARAEFQGLIPSVQLAAQDFEFVGMTAEQARAAIAAAGGAAVTTGSQLRAMGADALAAMEQFNIAMSLSQGIASTIDSAAKSSGALYAGKVGGEAGLARQAAVTAELETQRKLWEDQGYTQKEIAEVLMPGYVSQLSQADSKLFSAATNTKTLSEEARAAEQAFNNLKSSVESVLQSALDTGTGVDPEAVLEKLGIPRADAINENARRLADIAQNGLKGQDWLGDFASEVPDIWRMIRTAQNPQEEAAYLLRDFQDGLLTAAIDKGKAKEIVKRQIMGDQNMAALALEIAQEIAAEMGIPLQEAMAATRGALGVSGGGAGVGTEAANQFADGADLGLDERNAGGNFVDKFIAQTQAAYGRLKTAGGEAGKQWGNEFLAVVGNNVPPGLVDILVNLTTPGVMAQIAQRGTLTGAVP